MNNNNQENARQQDEILAAIDEARTRLVALQEQHNKEKQSQIQTVKRNADLSRRRDELEMLLVSLNSKHENLDDAVKSKSLKLAEIEKKEQKAIDELKSYVTSLANLKNRAQSEGEIPSSSRRRPPSRQRAVSENIDCQPPSSSSGATHATFPSKKTLAKQKRDNSSTVITTIMQREIASQRNGRPSNTEKKYRAKDLYRENKTPQYGFNGLNNQACFRGLYRKKSTVHSTRVCKKGLGYLQLHTKRGGVLGRDRYQIVLSDKGKDMLKRKANDPEYIEAMTPVTVRSRTKVTGGTEEERGEETAAEEEQEEEEEDEDEDDDSEDDYEPYQD